jgi:hypothetical protein
MKKKIILPVMLSFVASSIFAQTIRYSGWDRFQEEPDVANPVPGIIGIIFSIILLGFGGFLVAGKKKNYGWIFLVIGAIILTLVLML